MSSEGQQSCVALRSLSVETLLQKRIPWSLDAEVAATVMLGGGVDDSSVCGMVSSWRLLLCDINGVSDWWCQGVGN